MELYDQTTKVNTLFFYSPLVYQIVDRFQIDGINYWLDDKDILVGQVIEKAISEGIQKSWFFLVVLTPISVSSRWVERELNEASHEEIEGKKIVLPVIANGLKLEQLPPRLRGKLYVDLTSNFEDGYEKLKRSITKYLNNFKKS